MFRSSYEIESMAIIRCEEIRREIGRLDQINKYKKYKRIKGLNISEIIRCRG